MFCNQCGKPIESGTICPECAQAQAQAQQNAYNAYQASYANQYSYQQPQNNGNRMLGFGKALTSTILSFIGFIFTVMALAYSAITLGSGVALFMLSLPMVIISFIFGISSISTFRRATPKPIATLILGINGLVWSSFGLFYEFLILMVFATI